MCPAGALLLNVNVNKLPVNSNIPKVQYTANFLMEYLEAKISRVLY